MNRLSQLLAGLALCLAASSSHALLDKILGNDKFPFQVEAGNHEDLAADLEEALATQREESAEFELIELPQRAVQYDRRILAKLLEARGYYASNIRIEGEGEQLTYHIDPGPVYTIESIRLNFPEGIEAPPAEKLPAREGEPLRAADVLATQSELRDHILENYCLFDTDLSYRAQIDHETAKAYLRFRLKPSPQVVFGKPQIVGLESVEPDYVRQYFTFEEGQCFKRNEIEQTRLNLLQTNLLARAETTIAKPDNGEVVVTFELTERNHRTVRAGVSYATETKAGVTLGWQHRNLFGRGQVLDIETHYAEEEKQVAAELMVPHYLRKGQNLIFNADVTDEDTEAYDSLSGEIGVAVTRPLRDETAGSVGATLEFSRVEPRGGEPEDFALLSFPLSLEHNHTDNLLDPQQGWAFTVRTRPFVDLYQTGTRFLKTTVIGSVYTTAEDWTWRPTLAARVATGTISGINSVTDVPANHRYYAGGGGSVRGYEYQTLGAFYTPEGTDDLVPLGGLSFSETSLELRLRVATSWGAVLFVDGGYAYPGEQPSFGEDFRWGAGIGVRYFTSFAPIRFDIATPLNPRSMADGAPVNDRNVQLYISIGQAF